MFDIYLFVPSISASVRGIRLSRVSKHRGKKKKKKQMGKKRPRVEKENFLFMTYGNDRNSATSQRGNEEKNPFI